MSSPQPLGYYAQGPGNRDAEHLRLLSIFHYVAGGILAFFGSFPILYIVMGILALKGKLQNTQNAPPELGYIFIAIGIGMLLFLWGLAACLIISGKFIGQRRNYMFSFVIAAISCLQVPFGTLLGIFTIIVLSRSSVKVIYGRPA